VVVAAVAVALQELGQALEQAQVPVAAVERPEAPRREAAHSRLAPSVWERYVVFLRAPPAQPEQERRQVRPPEVPVARPKPSFREQLWFRLKTARNTPPTWPKGKVQSMFYLSTVETLGCNSPPE
jgi:hypothetical protein